MKRLYLSIVCGDKEKVRYKISNLYLCIFSRLRIGQILTFLHEEMTQPYEQGVGLNILKMFGNEAVN